MTERNEQRTIFRGTGNRKPMKADARRTDELPNSEKVGEQIRRRRTTCAGPFETRLPQLGVAADIRDRLMNHIPTDSAPSIMTGTNTLTRNGRP